MQIMILDELMFKSSVSAHKFTESRKMRAKGLYRKLSETGRARAVGCIVLYCGNAKPGCCKTVSYKPPDNHQNRAVSQREGERKEK